MQCPKCQSEDVKTQIVSEEVVRVHKHGFFYYISMAWLFVPMVKALVKLFTFPFRMFGKTETYSNTEHKTMCVCQNCGNTWQIK